MSVGCLFVGAANAATLSPLPAFISDVFSGNDEATNTDLQTFLDGITLSDGSTFDSSSLTLIARQADASPISNEGSAPAGWLVRQDCDGVEIDCNEQTSGSWIAQGDADVVVYKAGNSFVVAVYDPIVTGGTEVLFDVLQLGFPSAQGLSHMSLWGVDRVSGEIPLPPAIALMLPALGGLVAIRRRRRQAA